MRLGGCVSWAQKVGPAAKVFTMLIAGDKTKVHPMDYWPLGVGIGSAVICEVHGSASVRFNAMKETLLWGMCADCL